MSFVTANPRDICQTPIAASELASIQAVIQDRFSENLSSNEELNVAVWREEQAAFIELKLGSDETRYEMDFFVDGIDSRIENAVYLLVEFIGIVLTEFFDKNREHFLTLNFKTYDFRGHQVCARGQVRRPSLEAEADRLLRDAGDIPDDVM